MNRRDYRIDGVKLFLIVLVTIGHCIEPARSNPIAHSLYSMIYLFHMPLFVLISGYYASIPTKDKLVSKVKVLLETFLIVMIPQCVFYKSYHPLLNPENSGWYLISLLTWYLIVYYIDKYNVISKMGGGKLLIVSSLLISIAVFVLPTGKYGCLFSFNRTCMFLPWFMVGYQLQKSNKLLVPDISIRLKVLICFIAIVCFIACYAFSSRILHVLEFNNANVWEMSNNYEANVSELLGLKCLVMVGSVVTSYFMLLIIKLPYVVSKYGSKTLAYYVMQGIFAHILGSYFHPDFAMALLLSVLILFSSTLLLKFVDAKYITNPISSLINGTLKQKTRPS